MKVYLVGGAVRDKLLNRAAHEKDWVVVGATVDDMLKQGYRQVGKDFPVFLHPHSNEEYALARKERKVGPGYTGFTFDASTHVTLEDDLKRRDLTINAMAETLDGNLIDPYHGKDDLEKKLLRHVSPAFIEDPVRILRVARFMARFSHLGFTVAPETKTLMKKMVASGEVNALVAERVWKELEKSIGEKNPEAFFETLAACDALNVLFPKLTLQSPGFIAFERAASVTHDPDIRFAVLFHDFTEADLNLLCDRYRVPNEYRALTLLLIKYIDGYQRFNQLSAEEILKWFQSLDAFRRESRFKKFLTAAAIIIASGVDNEKIIGAFEAAKAVDTKEFTESTLVGKDIANRIQEKRIVTIQNYLSQA